MTALEHAVTIRRLLALGDAELVAVASAARIVAFDPTVPRKDCVRLLHRSSALDGGLDLPALARTAVVFWPRNRALVSSIVERTVASSALFEQVVPALLDTLADVHKTPLRPFASILGAFASVAAVARLIAGSEALVCRLCELYDAAAQSDPSHEKLAARLDIVDALFQSLRVAYLEPLATLLVQHDAIERLSAVVMAAMEVASGPASAAPRSLVSLSLLGDLEAVFDFSAQLGRLPPVVLEQAQIELLSMSMASLAPAGQVQSGLELLATRNDKGKGRQVRLCLT